MPIPKATLTPRMPIAYGATVVIIVIALLPMLAAADWIAVVKPGKPPYKMVLVKGKRKKVVLPPRFDLFDFAVIQKMF